MSKSTTTIFSLLADRRVYSVSPRASVEYVAPRSTTEGGLQVTIHKAGDVRAYWIGQHATSAQSIPGISPVKL